MTLDKYLTIAECLPKEQEPCEDAISKHDEDKTELVSKQDVVKLIDEWNAISFYEANEHSKECYYEIRNAIIAMQPVASCFDAISRQAAIEAIYDNKDRLNIAQAIRELPSVNPQEPCDDAISREDAMSMILCYGNEIKAEVMDDIKASMIKLPPVQQKTGHWICTIEDWNKWTCSECGFCERTDIHVSLGYNYCPKCGAKMESEVEQ